jgi:hypothetical protein
MLVAAKDRTINPDLERWYPFDAEEATGDRRQDATLDRPRRNVSGVQQVIELEEKAKARPLGP